MHFDIQFLNICTFFRVFNGYFNIAILMMSAALATRGHLKWKVFLNKGYDVLISVHDITKKIYQVTQII